MEYNCRTAPFQTKMEAGSNQFAAIQSNGKSITVRTQFYQAKVYAKQKSVSGLK